jgi:hypothetical protein
MPISPGLGSAQQGSELNYFLNTQLAGMGDYITQDQGTMAWCEALVIARMLNAAINFTRLIAAQLDPADASIFLQRWQNIFVAQIQDPIQYIQQIELETNTPPNETNIQSYIQSVNPDFLTLEWIPLQNSTFASFGPPADGYIFSSVVSTVLVHQWQPRDYNDNYIQSYSLFQEYTNNWQLIVKNWVPANVDIFGCTFTNTGGDGYAALDGYSFQDGYNNPVTGTIGSAILTSVLPSAHSTFEIDFKSVYNGKLTGQPFDIVDDNNNIHTLYVASVQSSTQLTLTQPLITSITGRTYRTLGISLGISGLGQSVFN